MLREIRVKNLALLEDVRVPFSEGFNVITGETGAGKSILIESLRIALGEKVPPTLIPKEETSSVEIVCEVGEGEELLQFLEDAGIDGSDFIILRRVVFPTGRSRSFINDVSVTGRTISEVTSSLVSVLGQHSLQQLFERRSATRLLDEYAGNEEILKEYRSLYRRWREAVKEIEDLKEQLPGLEARREEVERAVKELESAAVYPGEEEEIEKELPLLKNAAKIREALTRARALLSEEEVNILSLLEEVLRELESAGKVDPEAGALAERVREHLIGLSDLSHEILTRTGQIPLDDSRFVELTDRLSLIRRLSRKYGVFPDELQAKLEELRRERERLSGLSERLEFLKERERGLREEVYEAASRLRERREEALPAFEREVAGQLEDLELKSALFRVRLTSLEGGPGPWGAERADFLFAPVESVEPGPLAAIASGGELSRVMLAIHTAVAGKGSFETLIFDEVDAGIGGKVAEKVGEKLKTLSERAQVLCITHLPQIAALADHHVRVEKVASGEGMTTRVRVLREKERVEEIARMVSGEKVTPEAVRLAETLLGGGKR